MSALLDWLIKRSLTEAFWIFLIENILVWCLALGFGALLVTLFPHRRTTDNPIPTFSTHPSLELTLSALSIFINTLITWAGFYLWQKGIIVVKPFEGGVRDLLDAITLVLIIDLAMYGLHRLAHAPPFYRLLHTLHHRFEEPTSLTLFSLHPFETLSFGVLWLCILSFYSASIAGILLYLTFNVVFGVIGHCGVDPFPSWWSKHPICKLMATGTFHVSHHRKEASNFGFYTTIWDRLFGTFRE